MGTVFISIAGTQINGTFTPLRSVVNLKGPVKAYIFYTDKTKAVAEELVVESLAHETGEIEIRDISPNTTGENSAPVLARKIAEEAAARGDAIFFNLDGGMNYLISACVLAIMDLRPVLVQSTDFRTILLDLAEGKFYSCPLPEPSSVADILKRQRVEYEIVAEHDDIYKKAPLLEYCRQKKIRPPVDHLKNVRIGGIVFDLVWNGGNDKLCFLKDWRFKLENSREYIDRERDFMHWCMDRNRCGDMFDKNVFVLVWRETAADRFKNETDGRLIVKKLPERAWENPLRDALRECFRSSPFETEQRELLPPPSNPLELRNNSLVVCVGKHIDSTMSAIFSHKPENLLLCYSADVAEVRHIAENMRKLAPALGVRSVELVPFDIEGTFPEQSLPRTDGADPASVDVNITPGTKGQAGMLTLWARKHGFTIWSINNNPKQCEPLYNPHAKKPIAGSSWDPVLKLRLMHEDLVEGATSLDELAPERPALDAMLGFMREAVAQGREEDFMRFMRDAAKDGCEPAAAGCWQLGNAALGHWELTNGENAWSLHVLDDKGGLGGFWFEKLAAIAFADAGVHKIRLNLKRSWEKRLEESLVRNRKLDSRPFAFELDVVGNDAGNLFLASCKANPFAGREEIDKAAEDAKNSAVTLGRFGMPILAHLAWESDAIIENGVMIIGWRDLCRPEKLRECLQKFYDTKRTTN